MPLLLTLPVPWLFASIVRCGCDIGLVYVIKKANKNGEDQLGPPHYI